MSKPFPVGGSVCKCKAVHNKGTSWNHNHSSGTTSPVTNMALTDPAAFPEGTRSLHFAITNMKIADIQLLLSQDPKAVHEKGFNGQTPLHKAVMTCSIQVVDLLLAYKADPNALNDFKETPFHFACKHGDVLIMNLLLQNNANIKLVDQSGKGPIHHAVHGGSVLALHFLTDACGLSTHVRDTNLSTPLHVVCAHGHLEALDYLLRKERSDLSAHNSHGNNAMHIAANAGNSWSCWRLLEEGGLELLYQQNREGKLPLDLITNQKDLKFKETWDLLTYYTKCNQKSGRAKGPIVGWYFHGLLPLLSYPLLVILASQTSRSGAITLAGLVVLSIVLLQHSHRMNHVCRWPNPMYLALFFAGMLHSMICFYYSVLPVLYDQYRLLVQIMILWNIFSLYLYYVLLTRDPGVAKESARKPGSLWMYNVQDIADGTLKTRAFCVVCELIPPERTHHCKLCGHCSLKTDHHCLFLYRCIARDNHRLFLGFVFVIIIEMLFFLYATKLYFVMLDPEHETTSALIRDVFNSRPWQWSLFVGNAFYIVWGIKLLAFQLNVVSKGHTTAYQPNEGRTRLSRKQRLYNIVYFFMDWGYYATDVLDDIKAFNI